MAIVGGGNMHTGLLVRESEEKGQLGRIILKCILNILGIFRLNYSWMTMGNSGRLL